ncbi:MAG: DUF3857 and transglutaminase domain-containing protein [Calditrichae bacterium]|nr:DUF3857 and transglutaminase domain-containing protein [Calditrichia bacterium]
MKKRMLWLLLGVAFLVKTGMAQDLEKLPKFGKVSKEELAMTSYADDPEAEAVVLFADGDLKLESDGNMYFVEGEYHFRIKILTEEGKGQADIVIPYYYEDDIKDIKGITTLPNGKQIKLDKKDIFEEKGEKVNRIKFAMPGVEVGSVIEYRFRMVSEYIHNLEQWYFQNSIYTRLSRYSVTVLPYFRYNAFYRNMSEIQPHKDEILVPGQRIALTKYTWEMRDLPPIRKEPFMRTTEDYQAAIHFQIIDYKSPYVYRKFISDWAELVKEEREYLDKFYSNDGDLKALVAAQTTPEMTPLDKIKSLYTYVQNNIESTSQGGAYYDEKSEKILKNLKGTGSEKNLLLINLLRLAGLEAYPMLISTRSNGMVVRNQPRLSQFNYILTAAMIGRRLVLLDSRLKHYPYDILPERTLVDIGLLIDDAEGQFINLPEPKKTNMRYCKADAKLDESGTLHASVTIRMEGYHAIDARQEITADGDEEYVKTLLQNSFKTVELDSFTVDALENLEQPVYISAHFRSPEFAQVVGNMIYIATPAINKMEENPFKREKRFFPVEFVYNVAESDDINIELPEGYVLDELPQNVTSKKPNFDITFVNDWTADGNKISLKRQYIRRQLTYGSGDYATLRDFYDRIIGADQAQIVIRQGATSEGE